MLDSDFWRDLAEQFRILDSWACVRIEWKKYEKRPDYEFEIIGTGTEGNPVRAKFLALAARAGARMPRKKTGSVLTEWVQTLIALNKNESTTDSGIDEEFGDWEKGRIMRACACSAELCNLVEFSWIEKEDSAKRKVTIEEEVASDVASVEKRTGSAELIEAPSSTSGQRAALLSKYKSSAGQPSNRSIYTATNSGISKPEFYKWLRGTLPERSKTTLKFEKFLRSTKTPISKKTG